MAAHDKKIITVEAEIAVAVEKVWKAWTEPKHIVNWNNASDDWHTPSAENDLQPGGRFLYRMESTDGSVGFDFSGRYERIDFLKLIEYIIDDGRKVSVTFKTEGNVTYVTEEFEAEIVNSSELQKTGWQAILNNFKKYVTSAANI